MRLDKWLIGLLIMSTIILTGIYLMADVDDNYMQVDFTEDLSKFSDDLDVTGDLNSSSQSMKDDLFGGSVDDDNTENSMYTGMFSAARFVTNSFEMFGNMINSIVIETQIPPFFVGIAITVITLLVVFAGIYLVRGFQPN